MTSTSGTAGLPKRPRLYALVRQAGRSAGVALRTLLRWSARRIGTGAIWLVAVPLGLLGGYVVLFGPAALAVKATELALSTRPRIDELAAVALFMGITLGGLRLAFSHRRVLDSGRWEALLRIAVVLIFTVASFSSLTAVLYRRGALDVSPQLPEDRIFDKTAELYVWHLADSVPLLDIPQNLEWKEPFEVDRLGGFLLIVFTGVVILPLVPAVRLAAASRGDPHEHEVVQALRESGRTWKVRARPHTEVRHAAVVEELGSAIVVDFVRDLWTEELALRRLKLVRGSLLEVGAVAGAYVLVADRVGDRGRARIEAAFAKSDIRARLVAWRGDVDREPLASLVDGLFAKLVGYEDAAVTALEAAGEWRVDQRPPAENAPRSVVVDRDGARILVDVVRDARKGRAAARRFEEVSAAHGGCSGYLLVVGLAGLAAQWRIEWRFAHSSLPAKLAVCPTSWPGEQLATVVQRFLDELKRPPERAAES